MLDMGLAAARAEKYLPSLPFFHLGPDMLNKLRTQQQHKCLRYDREMEKVYLKKVHETVNLCSVLFLVPVIQ
jgi:hypothetical protein